MQPDILVNRLYIRVEPSDSSYMPSVVVINVGETIQTLKETRTINIGSTESLVTLLQDCQEVRPRSYNTFFMLKSVEYEILNAHKYINIEKFNFFQAQISLEWYFSCS